MLWIISVNSTVLPTPAPPNSPALPPRSSGVRTSITLIPVSKTSDWVERLTSAGGARCTERQATSRNGSPRSIVLPKTSNIRDTMALPTGARNGPPVSRTRVPRASPSVVVSAMPRTWRSSRCVSTSITIRSSAPARRTVSMAGRWASKRTSTTLPRTAVTTPMFSDWVDVLGTAGDPSAGKGVRRGRRDATAGKGEVMVSRVPSSEAVAGHQIEP
jgi:hypothetical protein